MPGFAHLCPECLDIPTTQCGYRACPQRAQPTVSAQPPRPAVVQVAPLQADHGTAVVRPAPALAPAQAYRDGSPMADATRAVTVPATVTAAPGANSFPSTTSAYSSLSPATDALATRFVDPAALPKAGAMPVASIPEPPPRRPPQPATGPGEEQP